MTKRKKDKQLIADQASRQAYDDEVKIGCYPRCALKAVQSTVVGV